MTENELRRHLQGRYPKENEACEWKEYYNLKHAVSGAKGADIISYVSALANMQGGHLVIGVKDGTLEIVGISEFHDYTPENIRKRIIGKCANLDSENFHLELFVTSDTDKTVWVFHIPRHRPRLPVYAHDIAWQRLEDSLVGLRPERRLTAILAEPIEVVDWTAEVIPKASLADLDDKALDKAREKFKEKNRAAAYADEIDDWDNPTFLDKAKLTIQGKITRATLLLLGNSESSHFLLPHPAQITWKLDAEEKAYEHFAPPFLLATTDVLRRIRNIKYKIFPDNYLLAAEVDKYETRVILEALHNCIAHQDYMAGARITVTEKVDRLIFENAGNFFDGNPEDYFSGERTPKRYRNPWLAQAMVNLNMIDTVGLGIHSMINAQRRRYFPLPDYSNSTPDQVVLEIFGHVIDENYTKLLLERRDLALATVVLLDRVQKRKPVTDEAVLKLRRDGLIEGRKPHYFVSARIAKAMGGGVSYTRSRGLEKKKLKEFVLQHLRELGPTPRARLEELLFEMLPVDLTSEKKQNKVKNLLTEMRAKDQSIISSGKGTDYKWKLMDSSLSPAVFKGK